MQTHLYIEGMHCSSCVERLERLPERVPFIQRARVHFGRSTLALETHPGSDLRTVLQEVKKLGYRARILPSDSHRQAELEARTRENRLDLIRLAVAGFGAGNVMMLAAGVYAGAGTAPNSAHLARLFEWISLTLATPVVFFSGAPFLRSIVEVVRARSISIDLPIATAIVAGYGASLLSLLRGHGPAYLDSATALIFLLLASRLFLKKLQRDAESQIEPHASVLPAAAHALDEIDREEKLVPRDQLARGTTVRVYPGELIPGDGIVLEGESHINQALLTGEPTPLRRGPGAPVLAGARNESAPLTIRLTADAHDSALSLTLDRAARVREARPTWSKRSDLVARRYITAMLIASVAVGILLGLERALALLVVTCPCALALATPLSAARALARGARQGIHFRSAEALEKLRTVTEAFFDKTGTLTWGRFEVAQPLPSPAHAAVIVALERHSQHPIARSLVEQLSPRANESLPEVKRFTEHRGVGVEGEIDGRIWRLGTTPKSPDEHAELVLSCDGQEQTRLRLVDRMRGESPSIVAFLKHRGIESTILSGDQEGPVQTTARKLGIPSARAFAGLSPIAKAEHLKPDNRALMVGDGVNDALALEKAFVGVSLRAGVLDACPSADVVITEGGIQSLPTLFALSDRVFGAYRVQLSTTLFYNLTAGTLAAAGWISPLAAALIMPMSSVTALLLSRRMT